MALREHCTGLGTIQDKLLQPFNDRETDTSQIMFSTRTTVQLRMFLSEECISQYCLEFFKRFTHLRSHLS